MRSLHSQRLHRKGLLFLILLGPACTPYKERVQVFQELESNDTPADANHFGTLRDGDRMVIEGVIGDPFLDIDGFSFTSDSPIHVDFQLFAPTDLDVCLYDPAIDTTIACFATADRPEQGGVDVLGSGFDFHLTVEACIEPGCFPQFGTPYSLELTVQPLFLASDAPDTSVEPEGGALTETATDLPNLVGVDARRDERRTQDPAAATRYKLHEEPAEPEEVPDLILEQHIEVVGDEESGAILTIQFIGILSPKAGPSGK
ncbi:MAG: hypothetical protein CMJ89_12020 [Planctomycetes bacterium]|nr:hypothetical protein [Planctomycetota bacterium]